MSDLYLCSQMGDFDIEVGFAVCDDYDRAVRIVKKKHKDSTFMSNEKLIDMGNGEFHNSAINDVAYTIKPIKLNKVF